jgi:hypothetical protein
VLTNISISMLYWQERVELEVMLRDDSSLAEEVRQEILECDQELGDLEVDLFVILFSQYITPLLVYTGSYSTGDDS